MTLKGKTIAVGEFPAPVFINPTAKELKELGTDIRFIIDFDNKRLITWSGYALLHDRVITALDKQENIKLGNIALGHSTSRSGKMRIFDFVFRCKNKARNAAAKDLSWLEPYFENIKDQWKSFNMDISILPEDYVCKVTGSHWGNNQTGELFQNPTPKELRSFGKEADVRFIINFKTKDIFVWPGNIVHYEVAVPLYNMKLISSIEAFGMGNNFGNGFWEDHFAGIGELKGGKIEYTGYSDTYDDTPDLDGWIGKDQKWLDKYFTEPFIKSVRKDFYIK